MDKYIHTKVPTLSLHNALTGAYVYKNRHDGILFLNYGFQTLAMGGSIFFHCKP